MTILMTGLCEKGADQIWKQCNDAMYAQGVTWLEEAAYAGDAEAWFFLGHCYSWGDGAVGFNEKKAYECYLRGASAGSARAVLGALRAGQYDEQMKQSARYSIEESYRQVRDAAEMGDVYAAWQMGEAVEWEDLADYMPQTESAREQCLFWYERTAALSRRWLRWENAARMVHTGKKMKKRHFAGRTSAPPAGRSGDSSRWGNITARKKTGKLHSNMTMRRQSRGLPAPCCIWGRCI